MFRPFSRLIALSFCCTLASASMFAQTANPHPPTRFPYMFTNFVWWTDPELRTLLKHRIPSLGDAVVPGSPSEARIRTALTDLLREKGIQAVVQSFDPSTFDIAGQRVPEAPPASILFSILGPPRILIEKLVLDNPPPDASGAFNETANSVKGKPYAANTLWHYEISISNSLQHLGYLSAAVTFQAGQPKQDGDNYVVPLTAAIASGPQYHVSSVKVDGGPMLQGKDLSSDVSVKTGDVANMTAFSRLVNSLRSLYWQAGYPDVEFNANPILDSANALVSYNFVVTPGPLYRLHSLTINNLNPTQRAQVQDAFSLKTGEVYDALAVSRLYKKLSQPDSTLKGYDFTYNAHEDKVANVVDLTLDFFKR